MRTEGLQQPRDVSDTILTRELSFEEIQELPPDGGYGWVCVACCFTINAFTWGVLSSYGVYLAYYLQNNIFPDGTSFDFALIGGLNFSMAMIVSPLATALTRRYGVHLPMALGILCQTSGFISASFARLIWQLYLSQGVLVGFGIGLTWIPSIAVLPQWFQKRRSMANGICSAGSGIGGLMFSFAVRAILSNVSLAWALRICGLVSGFMNILATFAIRSRNHIVQPRLHPFDVRLFRRYEVLLALAWGFVSMFGYVILLFSLSDFARSIGLGSGQAAAITALLNLGTAIGRPVVGVMSDKFGRIETAGSVTFLCFVSVFAIWVPATSYGATICFAIINGGILGVFWMTIAPVSAEVVGLKELPSMLSLAWMMVVLPCTFSEVIALKLRRVNASREFLYAQIFCGLAYLVASFFAFELWRVHRKKTHARLLDRRGD
ncbi:major facilitator superfamily protein [Hyaloscypha bicolor E]|uniref:Major facilitator superfamily protein n=1 Tax=Hyaloscypha bicolor E TaxID=1095630 RepID=A0A2J6SZU7_9HELO|nr:major facilitator superfamily protein [Hyaloscypha bicolor E]PMD56279.1 major facilitator superfamily protein [Hyaloscypha bicolor E]